MKVIRRIKIEVPGDLKALEKVLLQFNQIYQDFIPTRDWLQCRLALAEGFTNAVRHAHKNVSADIPIRIEVLLKKTMMEIKIWDRGDAFDLQRFIAESASKQGDWQASGRGIAILNKVSHHLEYYRTEQAENCLLIVKNFTLP